MVKFIKNKEWKPVEIDGVLINSQADGLIGLEVCEDYNIDTILRSGKRNNKRRFNDVTEKQTNLKVKKPKTFKSVPRSNKNDFLPSATGTTTPTKTISDKTKKVIKVKAKNNASDKKIAKKSGKNVKENFKSENTDKNVNEEVDMVAWDLVPLPKPIIQALAEQGFNKPTEIQTLSLPAAILGKRDILGAAETGSGKTLAFGLPILYGILKTKEREAKLDKSNKPEEESDESDFEETEEEVGELNSEGIGCVRAINNIEIESVGNVQRKPLYALILTPTRELAMQVASHLKAAAKYCGIHIAVVVGGMAAVKQERLLKKGPEIVVATPGRFWELFQQGNEHLQQIQTIKYLAIDETDRMLERGHFQELHEILECINEDEENRKGRQNFVFSATLTLIHELPRHLVNKSRLNLKKSVADLSPAEKLRRIVQTLGITDPKVVDITQGKGMSGSLTESRITCKITDKDYYLYYFLKRHPGRTLVFCNSIGCVKRLTTLLTILECSSFPLHAAMQQRQRLKNLDRFRTRENCILIATDVAARGLDIASIEHVIHYQTPRTSENYVHRSGRTARASKEGITVLLIEENELLTYIKLCRTLGKTEDIPTFPVEENYLDAIKQRVNLARDIDSMDLQVRRASSEVGWFQKAANDMDIIVDDEALKYDIKEANTGKRALNAKRKQLAALLKQEIRPNRIRGKYPLISENLSVLEKHEAPERAVDIMKNSLNTEKRIIKRPKSLFKPKVKLNANDMKYNSKDLMKVKEKKHFKGKVQKKRRNNKRK